MSFEKPNYTQIPNEFMDSYMKDLTPSQIITMMVIFRYTIGYHRRKGFISLNTFQSITNLSRQGVVNNIKFLQEKGWIKIEKGNRTTPNRYEVVYKTNNDEDDVVNSVDETRQVSRPQVDNSVDLLKKGKETKRNNNVVASFACLDEVNISDKLKLKMSKEWPEDQVKSAVKDLSDSNTDVGNPYGWLVACLEGGGYKKKDSGKERHQENKLWAQEVLKSFSSVLIDIQFCKDGIQAGHELFNYLDKNFQINIRKLLEKVKNIQAPGFRKCKA